MSPRRGPRWIRPNANLAKLTASGTTSDVAIQQASVAQAEQTLVQTKIKLEQTELRAPFGGIISAVDLVVGGTASGATTAIALIDRDPLHVDLKLSENDVAKIALGQQVTLTIDALRDWAATGKVSYIAPASMSSNGVVVYEVRVDVPDSDARVKVGMSSNLDIVVASKQGVLLVPNTALLPKGAGRAVQLVGADGKTSEVEVQTGLTDGVSTEIVGGLKAGDKVVTTPSVDTAKPKSNAPLGG